MNKIPLHWQIILSLGLAVLLTVVMKYYDMGNDTIISVCEFIGQLFMNALKMIVIPVIVTSILSGMFSMGSAKGFGKLGLKTILFYVTTSLLAISLGLLLVNIIRPGIVDPSTAEAILGQQTAPSNFIDKVEGKTAGDLVDIFLRMIPPNIFDVLSQNNQLLGVICASILIGFFLNQLPKDLRSVQEKFWQGAQQAMILLTELIIKFAPIGVFGLVTPVFFRTGTELLGPLSLFFLTVLLGLFLHSTLTMSLLLKFIGNVNPLKHFKAMKEVIITAFSTSSSAATLPITLDTLERKSKVSNRIASFTIPLGATVNMDGTALYECIVVIFVAQFYSVVGDFQVDLAMQVTVVILALLTSIGVAGIPSASLVAITVIMAAVGLPMESIGLVIAVDRILDMCRTSVNVFGDSVGAIIIARSEGEEIYQD